MASAHLRSCTMAIPPAGCGGEPPSFTRLMPRYVRYARAPYGMTNTFPPQVVPSLIDRLHSYRISKNIIDKPFLTISPWSHISMAYQSYHQSRRMPSGARNCGVGSQPSRSSHLNNVLYTTLDFITMFLYTTLGFTTVRMSVFVP